MPQSDPAAMAINAAGIADALACLVQENKEEAAIRFSCVIAECDGHIGLMQQVMEAGNLMERFRVGRGAFAKWGGELPYLYDVWDAIAHAIWLELDTVPLAQIVESAIHALMDMDTVY